jgi:hypothetical protein
MQIVLPDSGFPPGFAQDASKEESTAFVRRLGPKPWRDKLKQPFIGE